MDIKCLLSVQGKLHGFGVTCEGKMVTLTRRIPAASVAGMSVLKQMLYLALDSLPLNLQCCFLPICFTDTITCIFPIPYCSESPCLTPVEVWLLQFIFLFPCVLHFPSYEVPLFNSSQCFFCLKAK